MIRLLEASAVTVAVQGTETDNDMSLAQVQQVIHTGQRAKQKMIEANLRLTVAIAKKYQHRVIFTSQLILHNNNNNNQNKTFTHRHVKVLFCIYTLSTMMI